jgi:acylphosphatase
MITTHIIIKGKVQGVFYRATAKETAVKMGLTGWVKNTAEGNVEAMVTGDAEEVQKFIDWCRQGPPRAVVTELTTEEKVLKVFDHFQILR